MQRLTTVVLLIVLAVSPAAATSRTSVQMGVWRAVLKSPGGDLPFNFELADSDTVYVAHLLNGDERVRIDDVRVGGNFITLNLTAFNSSLSAVLENNMLGGSLRVTKRGGSQQVMPLRAWHGARWRFYERPTPPEIDVEGRWDVTFIRDEGDTVQAVGEFRQDTSRLFGTFLTPTGDYRYLEGDVRNHSLYLSCFDGYHVFLFKGRVIYDGSIEGDFWSGTAYHATWTGRRNESAALPDPLELTSLKPGFDRLDFTFPDIDGNEVSMSDEVFKGKVVIVNIVGSWCPNCHDETAFLTKFYDDTSRDDLEIVALMYEHVGDFEEAATQVRRFRDRYGVQYRTLIAGYSDKASASETLPMLNHVMAFPTTIFVDRSGVVRRIYTGFRGPGTGEYYDAFKTEFTKYVESLIDE